MGWLFLSIGVLLICWTSFYPMIQAFILSMKSGLGVNLKFTGLWRTCIFLPCATSLVSYFVFYECVLIILLRNQWFCF